ncbi:hypothetical protein ABZV91_15535 [Nocardia sp. NPDC004568]|uniref:hypothetical protein n=1 Tax=Nocardia sp. NPDC004568 TaxID=3154551 RepID=UPI0033A7ACC7
MTVGGPDLADFTPMHYDQWLRLFLPGRGKPARACRPWRSRFPAAADLAPGATDQPRGRVP